MDSTARLTDNNVKKSGPDKKENKVKGLYNGYIICQKTRLYIIWTRQRG